jgi:hypothetical protein
MEHVLSHFEGLEKQAKAGDFNYHPGIQNSITEAWNKATVTEYSVQLCAARHAHVAPA